MRHSHTYIYMNTGLEASALSIFSHPPPLRGKALVSWQISCTLYHAPLGLSRCIDCDIHPIVSVQKTWQWVGMATGRHVSVVVVITIVLRGRWPIREVWTRQGRKGIQK